jgi:lysozyme family protein
MNKYDPKFSKMQSRMRWLEQLKKEKEQEQIQQALKNNTSLTSFF